MVTRFNFTEDGISVALLPACRFRTTKQRPMKLSPIRPFPRSKQNEIELLILCARVSIEPEIAARILALVPQIQDWEYVVQAAIRHGVRPLLYQSLNKSCPQSIPPDVLNRLRRFFQANAKRNLFLTASLFKVLSKFESHNISAVPFKGPVLAESVYGDLYLRSFVDLDILVYARDAFKAFNLLVSLGYGPEVELSSRQVRPYVKTEYSIALFAEGGGVIIELHWDMTGRYLGAPFRLEHFSDRLEHIRLMGREVYQIPPEELLLYLCIHGSKDCWDKLELISSVAGLIRSCKDIDWVRVEELAGRMKCERILLLGLFLARDLFSVEPPEPILMKMKKNRAIREIASEIYGGLFPKEIGDLAKQAGSDFSYYHLRVRNSGLDKMLFVIRLVFRPSRQDWKQFPLSGRFAFLHYLLRPFRLISETMARSLKAIQLKQND